MAYRQGRLILAGDYNLRLTSLLELYDVGSGDFGYGQIDTGGQAAIPPVVIDALVTSSEWTAFRDAIDVSAVHQGSTIPLPPISELAVDEVIEAHDFADGNTYSFDDSLTIARANRLLFAPGSVSIFSNDLNSIRNVLWTTQIQHTFRMTLPTVDDARYFFNSGGEFRWRGSRSGGAASAQNTSWTNLLIAMGTVRMNFTDTTSSGTGTGSSIGYYDLTSIFQLLASEVDVGTYAGNTIEIFGRTVDGPTGPNGDNGRVLEFRALYSDPHTNPFSDVIDGTITSDIDYQKATSPLVIQTPVFITTVPLTAGA